MSSAWFIVFALMQFPVGWALDFYGPRRTVLPLMTIGAVGVCLFPFAPNAVVGSISPIAAESNFFNRVAEHSDINSVPFKRLEYNFGARAPLTSTGAYLVSHTNRLME